MGAAALAGAVAAALALAGAPPDPPDPPETSPGSDGAEVVALRDGPWTTGATDVRVVVVAGGGRTWVVDVDAATVTSRVLDVDGAGFTPIDGMAGDAWLTRWGGRAHAVPIDHTAPVADLGPLDARASGSRPFPSERPGAAWVVGPLEGEEADDDRLAATERAIDGTVASVATSDFPALDPPVAAFAGGLLVARTDRLDVVDPGHGAVRRLVELVEGRSLVAVGHGAAVLRAPPCEPGCGLVVVGADGDRRHVPPGDDVGSGGSEGSVAPGGRWMVHVANSTATTDALPRYVVTDLAAGRSRMSDVVAGPGVAWSPDGGAFVAAPRRRRGGVDDDVRLVLHRPATGETVELPVVVRVPTGTPWAIGG